VSEQIDDQHRIAAGENGDDPGRFAECEFVQESAAVFALRALDAEDDRRVRNHLLACAQCRSIVDREKHTVALLPFSTPTVSPPLDAKAALFSRIAQTARDDNALTPMPSLTIPASTGPTEPAAQHRWQLPHFGRSDSPRLSRFSLPLFATVPLVIALALVGGLAMSSQSDVRDLRGQLLSVRQDMSDTQESLDSVGDFTAQANTTVYPLPGRGGIGFGGAHGTLLANPGTNDAILLIAGLEDNPKDCRYEVWLEGQDGFMTHAAEFGVDKEGRSAVRLSIDQPLEHFMMLHIRRKNGTSDLLNSQMPAGDTIYAKIEPDVQRIFDRIGMGAE
jgi:hypothetical protein